MGYTHSVANMNHDPYAHILKQWAKYTHSVANMRVGDDSLFSPNTWSDPGENICHKRIGIISEKGQDSVADFESNATISCSIVGMKLRLVRVEAEGVRRWGHRLGRAVRPRESTLLRSKAARMQVKGPSWSM